MNRMRALTLADVARAIWTSESTVSRLESGARQPGLGLLMRLAHTYQVTLDELVGAQATGDTRVNARPQIRYGMTWLPLSRGPGGIQHTNTTCFRKCRNNTR